MADTNNLVNEKAIEKIKALAKDKICLLCTYENNKIVSRPMGTQDIDEDGAIWFVSNKDSEKNSQIDVNSKVYLMYLDSGNNEYLSLTGSAEILYDRKKIEKLWNPLMKAWFPEGKDDPEITLLKVLPEEGHYWDTKNGKVISMIKIAAAALTGKKSDVGVEGDIKVR